MIEVNFHAEASAEIEATMGFYDSRLEGLGLKFLIAVESQIERITEFPNSGYGIDQGLQKVVVFGFPFSIIYRHAEDHVLLLAVAHDYRRPGYWLGRSQ